MQSVQLKAAIRAYNEVAKKYKDFCEYHKEVLAQYKELDAELQEADHNYYRIHIRETMAIGKIKVSGV